MSNHWQCDACGLFCSRTHFTRLNCGMEGRFCDDCYGYDWEAYDEPHDPILHPELDEPTGDVSDHAT